MRIRMLLPKKVGAWCHYCNGFVPTTQRKVTTTEGRYIKQRGDGVDVDIEWEQKPVVKNQSFCKKCGAFVDSSNLPHQAIDRLRLIAEMLHGGAEL